MEGKDGIVAHSFLPYTATGGSGWEGGRSTTPVISTFHCGHQHRRLGMEEDLGRPPHISKHPVLTEPILETVRVTSISHEGCKFIASRSDIILASRWIP